MVANWRATYRQQLSSDFLDGLSQEVETAKWVDRIGRPGVCILVAHRRGDRRVDGFVACGPPFDRDLDHTSTYQVYNLHVSPAARGLGLGKALLKAAARFAAERGAKDLSLWVVPENNHARRFYEQAGMRADGARQREPVAVGESLEEVRYRGGLAPIMDWD